MSPVGDMRPGWRIVLDAFLAAPDRTLTNHELGDIRGVQAFRSRIADLRRMGCDITEGTYVARGKYRYRLVSWPPCLVNGHDYVHPRGDGNCYDCGKSPLESENVAAAQDAAAEAPDTLFDPEPGGPAPHYSADF